MRELDAPAQLPTRPCGWPALSRPPPPSPPAPYCDGSSWIGSVLTTKVLSPSTNVTYRGAWLRDALITTLATSHGFAAATDVAIGGCSAGGLTIYLNIDYLAGLVRSAAGPAVRIHGLADAGFFLDHLDVHGQPFRTPLFQWGFSAWNASAALSPACLAANAADGGQWRCVFAQYTARFIVTPTFFLNSRFDTCVGLLRAERRPRYFTGGGR